MNEPKHTTEPPARRIRSFVRREGRLTPGQQRALDDLWPRYGLTVGQHFSARKIFDRNAPLTLEIGFGNGASLAEMAAADPQNDFIGIEVHRPGVGHLLMELESRELQNVRIYCHDAVEVLQQQFSDASLDRVLLLFPDPWPKTRHHKRRIVQPDFIALVASKLKSGGYLHMATDWEPYARHMLAVMKTSAAFQNTAGNDEFVARPAYRPATKFEKRGRRLGHPLRDLIFQRY
jgi:tRNA (guanine-N7-)-methyltransferase